MFQSTASSLSTASGFARKHGALASFATLFVGLTVGAAVKLANVQNELAKERELRVLEVSKERELREVHDRFVQLQAELEVYRKVTDMGFHSDYGPLRERIERARGEVG